MNHSGPERWVRGGREDFSIVMNKILNSDAVCKIL